MSLSILGSTTVHLVKTDSGRGVWRGWLGEEKKERSEEVMLIAVNCCAVQNDMTSQCLLGLKNDGTSELVVKGVWLPLVTK